MGNERLRMRAAVLAISLLVSCASLAQCGGESAAKAPALQTFFVFLNRPANAPTYSKEKLEEIQSGHMANIGRLAKEGKLIMAGPFMDDTSLRGLFVFKAASADEVREWLKTDPAVAAGRLSGDVHPWQVDRGSIHDVTKLPENPGMEPFAVMVYRAGEKLKSMPDPAQAPIWEAHVKYQNALFASKQIEIGGPFTDEADFTGLTVAHGKKADAEKLAAEDPAVKAGLVRVEVHEWITAKGVLYH